MSSNPSRAPTRAQSGPRDGATSTRPPSMASRSRQSSLHRGQSFRGIKKAHYRPMVTVAPRRSESRSTRASTAEPRGPSQRDTLHQDQLSTIDEDRSDSNSIITALTSDIPKPRYTYNPPVDNMAASEMNIVTQYLDDAFVNAHMLSLCQGLLTNPNLPYNPYPAFLLRLRHLAEAFHMHRETPESIAAILTNPLQKTSTPVIWGVKGHTNVWGLKDIVHAVDPKVISDYSWLLTTVPPPQIAEVENSNVKGDILLALTGPAIFSGTFYPDPPTIDFNLEFMMYGTRLDMALKVFTKTLRDDVKRMTSSKSPHCFLGIVTAGDGKPTLWDKKRVELEKDAFFAAVEEAVKKRNPPIMKVIFSLTEDGRGYKKGSKKYVFHFIETDKDTGVEQFSSFAEHPYETLFSSIFLRKADAEAYVAGFKRYNDPTGRATTRATTTKEGHSRGETRNQSFTRRGRKEEQTQKQPTLTTMAEGIKEPVRNAWERDLAKLNILKGDACAIINILLFIVLMDRNKYKTEEFVDIYRFLRSTASQFHVACSMNAVLRLYVRQKESHSQEIGTKLFMQYKKNLLGVLDPSLHERSSDQAAAYDFLKLKLDRMTRVQRDDKGSRVVILPMEIQTAVQLVELDLSCLALQLGLNEDGLAYLKHLNIKKLLSDYREKYPDSVPCIQIRDKSIPEANNKKKGAKVVPRKPAVILKHGVEANSISQQRNLYVNVEWSVQSSMHPVVMATEGVLMQYLIDVRMDQVWRGYLMDLINGDHLPPNPYPRLITKLRQAAFKMELWREADAKLQARLVHRQSRLVDRSNYVFTMEECGGFGLSSALSAVMPQSFKKISVLANLMANQDVVSHKGQYQLTSGQAISGHSPLYGRVMPYLPYLELHEHYYIRGPINGDKGAIELFAKLVYDHVADLCSTEKYVIMGLFVDHRPVLDQDQLEEDQTGAEKVLIDATSRRKPIYVKLYYAVGWRYVEVHKYYMMHYNYIDHAEDKHQAYFPNNPVDLYQNVFLSQDEAVNHYQQSGVSTLGNPLSASNTAAVNHSIDESIKTSLKQQNLMEVHMLLLTKALINKNADYLCDTWRMLHSVAFQLEYIIALIQSLKDIIRYVRQHPNAVETAAYLEEIAAAKAKAKKGTTVPVKTFAVRESTVGYMVTAFCEKVEAVLSEPCSLVPLYLPKVVGDKLKEIVERHPQTQELSLIIEKQTSVRLNEIQNLLLPVKAAIETDIHTACSKVQEVLQSIKMDS
ncbi:uncharacterized protein LOC121408357 [Lytechinus variegatus]|uniref:uncharacterized protein LOC121408357 n=1 Tax=Lytechinus variegatus TaxID=7654 RepID=UPI001BB17128|nr:uncharacterized protein LOC121408357 [Lytechinus variegatus]